MPKIVKTKRESTADTSQGLLKKEEVDFLKQFDLDHRFGPCFGNVS